jgi:uncharacterized surface protein with fasciclin (FAS1) repeats
VPASNGIIHAIDAVLLPPRTLIERAQDAGNFETLLAAVDAAGLTDALSAEDADLTLFAPTDAAFEALEADNPGILEALLADPETLQGILLYHVIPGASTAQQVFERGPAIVTLEGRTIEVLAGNGALFIDGVRVIGGNIEASNGILHVLGEVLVPSEAEEVIVEENPARLQGEVAADEIDTFIVDVERRSLLSVRTSDGGQGCPGDTVVTVIGANGIVGTNDDGGSGLCSALVVEVEAGQYTVQVRGYAGRAVPPYVIDIETLAFVDLPGQIERAGIAEDGRARFIVDVPLTAEVTAETLCGDRSTNLRIFAANGQELGFDNNSGEGRCSQLTVELEAGRYVVEVTGNNGQRIDAYTLVLSQTVTADLVEVLAADGRFTTLVALLGQTGLDAALSAEGAAFTVLAPTDAAFAAAQDAAPELFGQILDDPALLTAVLQYHVLPVVAPAEVVVGLDEAATLLGPVVSILANADGVRINDVPVIETDIEAAGGIIHVLDGVLVPPQP